MPYGIHRGRKPSANRLTSCLSSSALRAASSPEPDIDTESPRDGLGPPSGGVESLATAPVPTPPPRTAHSRSFLGGNQRTERRGRPASGRAIAVGATSCCSLADEVPELVARADGGIASAGADGTALETGA